MMDYLSRTFFLICGGAGKKSIHQNQLDGVLEYFSAAACAAVTSHDEPSRAYGESQNGKDA
jgi:hypothetical protein